MAGMIRAFVDCHACACLIHVEDPACPFCGAAQRRVGAPLWLAASLVCGLGLVDIACDERPVGAHPQVREQFGASTSGTTTGTTTTGTTGTGTSTTTDDSLSNGDGSTYAGPDETSSTGATTMSVPGETTTTSASASGDGTTYAGPDETTTIPTTGSSTPGTTADSSPDGPTTASPDTASGTSSTGSTTDSGELQPVDKDGCGCSGPTRPRSGVLALLGLLVLRRRRTRRAP
jgi:MYXO-CTERM domain-containing protein